MKLRDCTKEELLFVINSLKRHCLTQGDYYVDMALLDVEQKREEKRFEEESRLFDLYIEKHQEAFAVLSPYDGQQFTKIPESVLKKARCLLAESDEAKNKWLKLTGNGKGRECQK